MKKMRRVLALLLCIVMVVGLIPTSVFAAETVIDAAIFCSDLHGSTSELTSILEQIAATDIDASAIGFVGDTCLYEADLESLVKSTLNDTTITDMYSFAESHDGEGEDGGDIYVNWDFSGEVEDVSDNYLVYTIRETDMQNASDATTAAPAFTTWYNGLSAAQKKLPIFIMSHRPLHDRRDDNAGAATWYSAISAAAESSDIVFFWGHNHTSENEVDQAAYYVAKDGTETFTVYNGDTVVPNFTYMNAGYINANGQNPARKPVATTVQITADSMIFQDYTTSGEYTNSSYSHNVTVEREFAAEEVTLSSIAISGNAYYYVGDELALTVTATYSDGSTKDVTADATLTGYDMNTTGTHTVTATYEGLTATYTIAVSEPYLVSVALTSAPTKLTYAVGETLDTTGMVVTATYSDGSTKDVTANATLSGYDLSVAGKQTVKVSYIADGTTYNNMSFDITVEQGVAEGVILEKIEITQDPDKTEYLISQSLVLDGMVVVATFSDGSTVELAYKEFSTSTLYGGYELYNFSMYVEKAHELAVVYTYGDVTCYDTTTINVWNEEFADEATSVKVHVANADYGVTTLNVAPSTNAYVASALANVMKGGTLVAYDITLTLDADVTEAGDAVYALTNGNKTVTMPIPSGVNNPVVYYVSDDGTVVTNMNAVKDGNGNVTFTTTHFSTYVIGENIEITVPENDTATGSDTVTTTTTKTVYVLTSSISSGNSYLIADSASAGDVHLVANDGGDLSNTTATVVYGDCDGDGDSEYYIELTDATNELWTVSNSYQFANQDEYLRCSNGSLSVSSQSTTWSYSSNRLSYTSSSSGGGGNRPGQGSSSTTYYLRYNNGWTVTSTSSSASSIYFYVPTEVEVETETTVSGTYTIEGKDITAVVAADGSTTANLTSTLTFTSDSGDATTEDVSTTATYEIVTVDAYDAAVDGDPNDIIESIENGVVTFTGNYGKALVKVSYTTDFGVVTDYITIEASAPYYTIDLCEPVTDDEGNTTYESITAPVALKGIVADDTYSVWAVIKLFDGTDENGTDLGDVDDDRIYWSIDKTNIATIDPATGIITFTGKEYGTFTVTAHYLDENGQILCSDTITISVSESQYVVPGDGTDDFPEYPNEGAVRFDKTATAVGNYSETGIALVELSMTGVPYTTDNAMDVVVMLDMTGSMSDDGMESAELATIAFVEKIVKNEDGSYNDNRVAVYAFNSGDDSPYELVALSTIKSDAALETANTAIKTASDKQASGGTPYDEATKQCYDVLQAAKTDGIGNDRQQFCVFMSDGGPTAYEGSDGYLYYGGNNSSGDRAITSYISGYTSSTSTDWEFNMPTEYYTDQMKAAGVTVYTVGLLLQNAPSSPAPWSSMTDSTYDSTTDSLTTIGSHYYFTSTLLKNMATDTSKYIDIFDVDNADNATAKFTAIAQSILEAAKDVKVEDKIGSNYSVNFSLPGYGTEYAVDGDALDGLTEFYIQVVDYVLDSTTHERTGVYTVLENFTFNLTDGTLKSHTVDGVECTDCSHVTTDDDGTITAIDGTYFDYKSDDTGEYLNWEAEKLTSTELALQYFAHLDGSTGVAEGSQIPAGTYYTNEYATLTYTNYNEKEVQQEFPVPQMTWNGAQVSYVFYLVNDAGQPVNRAGRVVPFTEAVYVTDVYTHAVLWNDLEQAAGLEAQYLALEKVPEVYALYDDDAAYNIHVYEDENKVNLNNHFVIMGDVTDDYNVNSEYSWTNANTTYVFNNKSDTTKYYAVGTYIANDGDDINAKTTYLCKGSGTMSGVAFSEATVTDEAMLITDAYYVLVDNVYTRALTYTEGTTYYKLTAATYTAATGETRVKASELESTTGGTVLDDGYVYYVDENGQVYTIVQKSNGSEVRTGFDFSNTTVAFAVVWKPRLETDTVVVDYGLDVVIDVSKNDALASGVVGVRADAPANVDINSGTYEAAKAQTVDVYIDANSDDEGLKELKIGTASVENLTSVRFSIDKENGTQFDKPALFYYESDANYYDKDGVLQQDSMYSSVIVIPASTVYYEDEYVTLNTHTKQSDGSYAVASGWDTDSVAVGSGITQAADRPGFDMITAGYDANNPYGYDAAYDDMATYSMDNSAMITVLSGKFGSAQFTFYGTGFDIIGLTSNDTGFTTVDIYSGSEASGTPLKTLGVDTYYGYSYGLHEITYKYLRDSLTYAPVETPVVGTTYYTVVAETFVYEDGGNNGTPFTLSNGIYTAVSAPVDGKTYYKLTCTEVTFAEDSSTEVTYYTKNETYDWVEYSMTKVETAGTNETKPENPAVNDFYVTYENRWYPTPSTDNALYQVPVISYEGLAYGQYTVYLKTAYNKYLDHTDNGGSYDFYLDAIRIHNPVAAGTLVGTDKNGDEVYIEDIYEVDNEGWPVYTELRSNIIDASKVTVVKNADGSLSATLTNNSETIQSHGGAVFIDGNAATEKVSDYVSYGPNNELYLAKNQAVAFKVNPASKSGYEVADVQLGMKSANGGTVTYLINGDTVTLESTTDMYYSIKDYADDSIVITNNGDGVLSITNIKVTYKVSETATSNEDAGVDTANLIYTDEDVVTFALMSLRPQAVEEDTSDKTENTTPETEDTTASDKNTTTGSTSSNTGSTTTDTDSTSTEVTVPETENSTTADTLQKEESVPEKHAPAKTEKPAPETENDLFNEDTTGEVQEESFWSMVLRKIVQALNWLFGWLKG